MRATSEADMSARGRALRGAIIAVAAVAVLIAGVGIADAHLKKYATTTTAAGSHSKKSFEGDIFAKPRCKPNRLVTVFNAAGVVQGQNRSNEQGKWRVDAPGRGSATIPPGAYFALVKKRVLRRGGGHKHVCRSARVDFTVLP
jgi:hypothetical protein